MGGGVSLEYGSSSDLVRLSFSASFLISPSHGPSPERGKAFLPDLISPAWKLRLSPSQGCEGLPAGNFPSWLPSAFQKSLGSKAHFRPWGNGGISCSQLALLSCGELLCPPLFQDQLVTLSGRGLI